MKNTTKLKAILQLYTLSLDMDDDGNFHLTMTYKRTGESATFVDKAYTIVVGKAFWYMSKNLRKENKI
ncbi:MAG TPA: hypothetical protein VII99_09485 [Bacteroidia bacterium]